MKNKKNVKEGAHRGRTRTEDLEEEVFILLFPLPRPFFAPFDLEEDVPLSYSLHTSRVLQILVLYLPLDFGPSLPSSPSNSHGC